MSSINTNLSAMTALQALKSTQNAMNKNQNQISTGLRVGEASHNASYWSISTKMKSDNGALGAVKDSIKQSKAMIDTYSSAMDKSLKYLDTMKAKLTAGSNPGANLEAIQVELKSSIEGLKSAAGSATFNGQNWLSGDSQTVKLVTSYDGESKKVNTLEIDTSQVQLFDDAANPTGGLLKAVSNIDIANPPKAQGFADFAIDEGDLSADDVLRFKLSDGTEGSYELTGATTLSALATSINADATINGLVEASVVDGKLRLTSVEAGKDVAGSFADKTLGTDTGNVAAAAAVDLDGDGDLTDAGDSAAVAAAAGYSELTINTSDLTNGDEISFSVDGGATTNTFKVGSEKSIDDLVASINSDEDFNGLVTASNVDGKLRLTANNVANDVAGSFSNVKTGVATTNGQLAVADALKSVDRAINDLRAGSAMLGANKALLETQEEFIGVLSDSLTAGVSAFIDADMNEASTRNQALQTQQQLGVQALSMANQNSQMILKLFQ
jgi:flagellin